MFTRAERDLLRIGRAVISLPNHFIVTEELDIIDSPTILVDLFTKVELESFKALLSNETVTLEQIEEAVVYEKVIHVLGVETKLHVGLTPAGLISSIARAIISKSEQYVLNEDNLIYLEHKEHVTMIETMCAIISFYTSTPYSDLLDLPINEIYRRYAVCATAFPTQVQHLGEELPSPG